MATRTGERQIAKLVEDHELVAAQLGRERAGLADPRLILELRHQIDGVEVATTGTGTDNAGGDRAGEVGLAGARAPDHHDVAARPLIRQDRHRSTIAVAPRFRAGRLELSQDRRFRNKA